MASSKHERNGTSTDNVCVYQIYRSYSQRESVQKKGDSFAFFPPVESIHTTHFLNLRLNPFSSFILLNMSSNEFGFAAYKAIYESSSIHEYKKLSVVERRIWESRHRLNQAQNILDKALSAYRDEASGMTDRIVSSMYSLLDKHKETLQKEFSSKPSSSSSSSSSSNRKKRARSPSKPRRVVQAQVNLVDDEDTDHDDDVSSDDGGPEKDDAYISEMANLAERYIERQDKLENIIRLASGKPALFNEEEGELKGARVMYIPGFLADDDDELYIPLYKIPEDMLESHFGVNVPSTSEMVKFHPEKGQTFSARRKPNAFPHVIRKGGRKSNLSYTVYGSDHSGRKKTKPNEEEEENGGEEEEEENGGEEEDGDDDGEGDDGEEEESKEEDEGVAEVQEEVAEVQEEVAEVQKEVAKKKKIQVAKVVKDKSK